MFSLISKNQDSEIKVAFAYNFKMKAPLSLPYHKQDLDKENPPIYNFVKSKLVQRICGAMIATVGLIGTFHYIQPQSSSQINIETNSVRTLQAITPEEDAIIRHKETKERFLICDVTGDKIKIVKLRTGANGYPCKSHGDYVPDIKFIEAGTSEYEDTSFAYA